MAIEAEKETKKRLDIAEDIASQIKKHTKAIVLGGSMGYGQNYSVTKTSDIDMVVICDKEKVEDLVKEEYFEGKVDQKTLKLYLGGKVDMFWATRIIEEVRVDMFVYDSKSYEQFCTFKQLSLKAFRNERPEDTYEYSWFDGSKKIYGREITPFEKGFIYVRKTTIDGGGCGDVPLMDFLYSAYICYEEEHYWSEIEKKFWKEITKKLHIAMIKEGLGIDKLNLINTHWTIQHHPKKVPKEISNKITERTKKELEALQSHS